MLGGEGKGTRRDRYEMLGAGRGVGVGDLEARGAGGRV